MPNNPGWKAVSHEDLGLGLPPLGGSPPTNRVLNDKKNAKNRKNLFLSVSSRSFSLRGKTRKRSTTSPRPTTQSFTRRLEMEASHSKECLSVIFNQIVFHEQDPFIIEYILQQEEDFAKQKEIIRAVVEIGMVEGLIVDFLFSMLKIKYEEKNQFSMEPLPQVQYVDSRDKQSKRITYAHTATSYVPWMLFQGLVILRSASLIRQIDAENNRTVSALLKRLKSDSGDSSVVEPVDGSSQMNIEHPVYDVMKHLLPNVDPNSIVSSVLHVCTSILDTVIQKSEKNIPLDVKNLAYRFSQYCESQAGESIQQLHDECLFWCFLFPLLNLTTIITRKRSAMSPDNFAMYLICFLFIREASLQSETEEALFVSISPDHQETMGHLRKQFLQIATLFEQYEHKSLADKVLSMNTTADEEKSQQLLIESVNAHFEDIYEELVVNSCAHENLLARLAPFAEMGFQEEIYQK